MASVSPDSLLLMGSFGRAHGIAGEVKVFPITDDPYRFTDLERVFLGEQVEGAREVAVTRVRFQPQKGRVLVLLGLEGITDRDQAETLRNLKVWAHEDDLPPLEEGELFVQDLIGLAAETEEGDKLGTIRDVLDGGPQLLLVVARDGQPEVLVPDVPEIVLDVDVEAGRIVLDPPEGLFEG